MHHRDLLNALLQMDVEARDPRAASDVVVQLLAFRRHGGVNAPTQLSSMYFTYQFYHFEGAANLRVVWIAVKHSLSGILRCCQEH
jgi:hypothetical protein